jgi:hypothetical protein
MMEGVCNSETSVYFKDTTQRYIPEGSHLHIRRCESLKALICIYSLFNDAVSVTENIGL